MEIDNKWRSVALTMESLPGWKKWVLFELEELEKRWDKKEIPLTHFDAETHYVLKALLNAIELLENFAPQQSQEKVK